MPAFPPETVILHVGPPKTGTTSVQDALDAAADRLEGHGVALPGGEANPRVAVNGGTGLFSGPVYAAAWSELVSAAEAGTDRRQVVSSEQFAYARAADADRVVLALGGERVRIVITLRPLVEILPSRWQQFVQSGETRAYPDWLAEVLDEPPTDEHGDRYLTQIWQRRFVERWAAAAGAENTTVMVVDRGRREALLRGFEDLLGLPERTLAASPGKSNDSLSLAETEFLRHCYAELAERGWTAAAARRYLLSGSAKRMRLTQPNRSGARDIVTPVWAQERAVALGAELAEALPDMGVRVVGDPAGLVGKVVDSEVAPAPLDPSAAVQAMVGALEVAADLARRN